MTSERRRAIAVCGAVGVLALLIGYRSAQAAGLRVVGVAIVGVVLVGARATIGAGTRRPARRAPADPNADFPRYRQLVSALRFAGNRRADFDRAARPPLVRLLSRVLAERHDVRIASDRAAARVLVGPCAWWVVEQPSAAASDAADAPDAPGVARDALEDVVTRIEELSS
jgi:hypothetical protein